MNQCTLVFNKIISELEQKNEWITAARTAYQQWQASPDDINLLLCAGTELWHTLLVMEYHRHAPLQTIQIDYGAEDELETLLQEISSYGEQHFAGNARFCSFFGYMYQAMPDYFLGYDGDYCAIRDKGRKMMHQAATFAPQNPLVLAFSSEVEGGEKYASACKELWCAITPQEWGDSAVQQYFFHILCGDQFCPNAYSD